MIRAMPLLNPLFATDNGPLTTDKRYSVIRRLSTSRATSRLDRLAVERILLSAYYTSSFLLMAYRLMANSWSPDRITLSSCLNLKY